MTEPERDHSSRPEPLPHDHTLRVRCHELSPVVGDLERNSALIEAAIGDSAADGVQLLVLPELATSGYHLTDTEAHECALPVTSELFARWACLLGNGEVLAVGYAEAADDVIYNSAAIITRNGVEGNYRKTHLWDAEKEVFTPGASPPPVIETPIGRIGLLVCYDLEFPEMPRGLALTGAEILAVPTNWPLLDRPADERAPEVVQAMAAARSSAVAIACCDRCGDERGTLWTEGSSIIGTDGWLLGRKDDSRRVDANVQLRASRYQISQRNDLFRDRRPNLYLDGSRR